MQRYSPQHYYLQNGFNQPEINDNNSIQDQTTLSFIFEFLIPSVDDNGSSIELRQSLEKLLEHYCGKLPFGTGSYSIQQLLEPVEVSTLNQLSLFMFKFDSDFIGNFDDNRKFDRWQLIYLVEVSRNDHQDEDEVFGKQKILQLKFGHIESQLRRLLRNHSSLTSSINDNFLNFLKPLQLIEPEFRKIYFYQKLIELAKLDRKVQEMIRMIDEQLDGFEDHVDDNDGGQSSSIYYCLSFNGGKDCTVLLHVLATLLDHRGRHRGRRFRSHKLNLLLIKNGETFPELDQYVRRVTAFYDCNLWTYSGRNIKSALALVRRERPKLRTIFMGVRRSDMPPKVAESLSVIQPTDVDQGWPEFTRISPLLDWLYGDIWNFLRRLDVPYCPLYNYGYSSIGNRWNTVPNPSLKLEDSERFVKDCGKDSKPEDPIYLPAYLLDRDSSERCCRV